MSELINLKGKLFGRWMVLYKTMTHKERTNGTYWRCKCDCGNEKDVPSKYLRDGQSRSCGCYMKQTTSDRSSKMDSGKNMLMRLYKGHAKRRNIPYRLSDKDFTRLTQSNCYYCGVLPSRLIKKRSKLGIYTYNGIDRKNNNLGYTIKNCVSCCYNCNFLKSDWEFNEFLSIIKSIAQHLKLCQH